MDRPDGTVLVVRNVVGAGPAIQRHSVIPRMDTGTLIVTRPRQYADSLRRYRIIVDDREVGRLKVGEEFRVELPEGEHRMVARIDWGRSNHLSFGVKAGRATEIEVGSNARGWLVILALYFATIGFW